MRQINRFDPAGHTDGPPSPSTPPPRQPSLDYYGHSGGLPILKAGLPNPLTSENHKPGSARPQSGSGGTRNMAQHSVAQAKIPMSGGNQ